MTSPNSEPNPLDMSALGGQISASLTLPQGMGLQSMPIMLSLSLPEKDKGDAKMGVLPPVLQLIQQSGLQTLSQIFPQAAPPLTNSSQATPILDYTTVSPAHPETGNSLSDTTQKPSARPSFDLSSFLKLQNSNELVSIQNRLSLANTCFNSLANIVQASTDSPVLSQAQTLTSSSEQENDNRQSDIIDPSSTLSSSQAPAVLQNLSVQDAIVQLGSGEFTRSDLISPHLESLVSNATFIQQCANQDLASGQYVTNQTSQLSTHQSADTLQAHGQHAGEPLMSVGDQCQMTTDLQSTTLQSGIQNQILCQSTSLGHQTDGTELSSQHQEAPQLSQHHMEDLSLAQQKCNDVAIGNEMTVVGYSPQDYLHMQANLATAAYIPIREEIANQDPSTVAASLASQIEAISSAITNQSGLIQLPTTGANPQCPSHLVDLVLKLAGRRDANTPHENPAVAVSIPVEPVIGAGLAIPEVFVSFCVGCNAASETSPCLIHDTEYTAIADSPIPSKARASLPTCLYLKSSETILQNVMGVWSKVPIKAKSKFGPLVGKVSSSAPGESKLGSLPEFKVIYSDKVDQYDLDDEEECNWLKFVQMARTEESQNMVVTQMGSDIYFFTTKDVYPGEELLFWYSKDYARFLGIPVSPETKKIKMCYVCGKVFVGRLNLRAHQKLLHADVVKRKWNCNMCEQGFTSSAKLNDHMNIHMGIKPHTCQYCGKRFTDQSNLRQHLLTHTNVKRFSCNQCGNQFRQKIHLQTHMLIHTGEKNLQCSYCVKKFARESDRKQHQYQHTKEKIYQCTECNKIFYKLQNYKRHLLMHTGEKNHACPKCQKRFYTKYHLQRHSKICKGATTKIYLNKHEKNLNLEEIANELTAGPSGSRTLGTSTATS
ncbi:PR domain zinc finger protein 4-like [Mizuhopecten yessoensis]|uniref:PR domain zinc finger protein 4 n=1 Tax=Mizuhopecten yessoensis TaxID=6573 RepID=A0A210QM14_MIZYE|nr:PR domain zinc finger protein 4-like [Mizuhopecten yessoensis]OWF49776.1 PR domain zinc finger protein 4 [Mizuhopecten yessoensis]